MVVVLLALTPTVAKSIPGQYDTILAALPPAYVNGRSEHLNRHKLNHDPKEIFACSLGGCRRRFVRNDLRVRHEERHRVGSLLPVSPASISSQNSAGMIDAVSTVSWPVLPAVAEEGSDSTTHLIHASTELAHLPAPQIVEPMILDLAAADMDMDMQQEVFVGDTIGVSTYVPSFGDWLFDADGSTNEFDFTSLPFFNQGMEQMFENSFNPASDVDSPSSRFSMDLRIPGVSHVIPGQVMSEPRRQELLNLVKIFMVKEKKAFSPQLQQFLSVAANGDIPYLSLDFMHTCLLAFWNHTAPQMPFMHRPTFSPDTCNVLLLAALVMLGSSTLHRLDSSSTAIEYAEFAGFVAEHLRWEVFTHPDASPPAELWVQQALLLVELFEKMFSSRDLHERAHIHHASTIALLRRGNPLVGRSGSESPRNGLISRSGEETVQGCAPSVSCYQSPSWWRRWAKSESQNRVVFAAYLLDCSHSMLFGHAAVLFPHEILLPLPCDDILWNATDAESLQRADQNLRMYGLKSMSFLDGLKKTVHGEKVETHPWARKILIYGLISVGYHISHRESILTCFDSAQAAAEQDRCRKLLIEAFDIWKVGFDKALTSTETLTGINNQSLKLKRNFDDPHTIYFLAHLSMHSNIIDLQTLAGSTRLSGRRVTSRDRTIAEARVKEWSKSSIGRHAVSHAFKFLHTVLIVPQSGVNTIDTQSGSGVHAQTINLYSCREDELNYRPWVIYLATLTIWAYLFSLDPSSRIQRTETHLQHSKVIEYLCQYSNSAVLPRCLSFSLLSLLDMLHAGFVDAQTHLQREARDRLNDCRNMIIEAT